MSSQVGARAWRPRQWARVSWQWLCSPQLGPRDRGAVHLPSPPTVVGGPCLLPPFPMSISRLPPRHALSTLTRGSQANIQIKNCWVRVSLSPWIMALGGWVHSIPFQSHPVPTLDSPALTGHPQRAAASLPLLLRAAGPQIGCS